MLKVDSKSRPRLVLHRRDWIRSSLLGLAGLRAWRVAAAADPLSWESVMAREWKRPRALNRFRGVHPRLFLTGTRVADLRKRISDSHREVWGIVKENADAYLGRAMPSNYDSQGDMRAAGRGIPWQALAHLMTGASAYLEGARTWMLRICEFPHWEQNNSLSGGECLFGVAVGYDWLHDKLTLVERVFVRDKLVRQAEAMRKGPPVHHDRWLANHNHVEHLGLAAAGFALFDEIPQALDWIRQSDLVFRAMFHVASSDGSSTEGHQYWGYTTEATLRYTELARDLLGTDFYSHEWLKGAPGFVIYSTLPDFQAENCVMSFGDSHRHYASHGPTHILYRLAAEYKDGHAQWLARELERRRVGRDAYCTWANLLWYDDGVKSVPISNLPTFRHFDDIGWITSRSAWDERAVMVGFKCGPMHGHKAQRYYDQNLGNSHEIGGGHGHPDVNGFQIYAYGKWLAIDPGYERPKWTRNHNCVLVNGRGQLGEGQTWFDRNAVLKARASSTIIRAEHEPDYDYIVGDAINIYPDLRRYYRHFIFVKPDFIVVVDELEARAPAGFEWLLHAEAAIEPKGERYFAVRNEDVMMDVYFLSPERLQARVHGKMLAASPERGASTTIVAVMHPRPASVPPGTVELRAHEGSRLELTLRSGRQRTLLRINFVSRRVALERI